MLDGDGRKKKKKERQTKRDERGGRGGKVHATNLQQVQEARGFYDADVSSVIWSQQVEIVCEKT